MYLFLDGVHGIYGYCTDKEAFRLFKLNRVCQLVMLEKQFERQPVELEKLDFNQYLTEEKEVEAIFTQEMKYLLIDEYGAECFTELEDGRLYFKRSYTNEAYMVRWLLGFGDQVQVIAPHTLVNTIYTQINTMQKLYSN